jgi:hypothetical protein
MSASVKSYQIISTDMISPEKVTSGECIVDRGESGSSLSTSQLSTSQLPWQVRPLAPADLPVLQALLPMCTRLLDHPTAHYWGGWWQGALVAVAGFTPHTWAGVWNATFLAIPGRLHGRVIGHLARSVRAALAAHVATYGVWRLQSAVHTGYPEAITLVEHFNFRREGLMRQYGPDGADYWLYSWVRGHDSG